jgi:hypothetical protein
MAKKDDGPARGTRTRELTAAPNGRTGEYDQVFAELVQSVANELPRIESEEGAAATLPRLKRSGVYLRAGINPAGPLPAIPPLMPARPLPFPPDPGPIAPPGAAMIDGGYPTGQAGLDEGTDPGLSTVEPTAAEDAARQIVREELRVDVDGLFPTMTISGSLFRVFGGGLTWMARVAWNPSLGAFVGAISYRDGITELVPHTDIQCRLLGGHAAGTLTAQVTFSGGGQRPLTRTYQFLRGHFREVGIEVDRASDATAVTSYHLTAHPNRPSDLPNVTLTIEDAFTRQGIRMTNTTQSDVIPIAEAGANKTWSDIEMHDAMQRHWSLWADKAQWQVWTLFAGLHDMGPSLGGIMFDEMGDAQRQGCSVFSKSFISEAAPPGDPAPEAFVQRMQFWTAVHEIGHTFNLLHSWDKDVPGAWIPLTEEREARSYMNYPYRVSGGPEAFFENFYYRFSDNELMFLRHAPERFVQQGNAEWLDHHAFEQARAASSRALELTVRVNRAKTDGRAARYESMEPVIAELKLRNNSRVPVVVDRNCLYGDDVMILIARDRGAARRWMPYQRYCLRAEPHVLQPGESLYAPCFLSAGRGGWELAEPGTYRIYAALRTPVGHAMSAPLPVRVDPPMSREEQAIAPDVFTDEVGRVLAFGGSRVMTSATDTLRDAAERVPERRIAQHAAAALSRVAARPGRVLVYSDDRAPRFDVDVPDPAEALPLMQRAYGNLDTAADTFGHIRLTQQIQKIADGLAGVGDKAPAAELTARLAGTLQERKVLDSVVTKVRKRAQQLGS